MDYAIEGMIGYVSYFTLGILFLCGTMEFYRENRLSNIQKQCYRTAAGIRLGNVWILVSPCRYLKNSLSRTSSSSLCGRHSPFQIRYRE